VGKYEDLGAEFSLSTSMLFGELLTSLYVIPVPHGLVQSHQEKLEGKGGLEMPTAKGGFRDFLFELDSVSGLFPDRL